MDERKTQIGYEIRFTRYFKHQSKKSDVKNIIREINSLQKYMSLDFFLQDEKQYREYKSVDEIWLSDVPVHWETIKIKRLFDERTEKGYPNEPMLAATQNMGVVPKKVYGQRTVEASKDLHLLKLVKVGDFVISLRSFQGGIELAHYQGIISPAYTILIPKGITVEYFKHLAKSKAFIELLQQCVTGIREGQNIDYSILRGIRIPVPPREEQLKIAAYLDSIDEIKLLKKYKEQIESDIVTGQIDIRDVEISEIEYERKSNNFLCTELEELSDEEEV